MPKEATVELGDIKIKRSNEHGQELDANHRVIDNKANRRPTLIQNDFNQYKFVPREVAEEMVKAHKAVIIEVHDGEEYVKGTKLALGVWQGFKPGEMIQMNGKAVPVEDIGKLDTKSIIQKAEEAVKQFSADKEAGIVPVKELPPSLATFAGKKRANRF